MSEPTVDDIDALVGPATPHFAYQLRARVRELVEDLPPEHPVRKYGEEKMELLDRLGHASSLAEDGEREPPTRIGWDTISSSRDKVGAHLLTICCTACRSRETEKSPFRLSYRKFWRPAVCSGCDVVRGLKSK